MADLAELFHSGPCFCGSGRPYGSCHHKKVYKHPAEIFADQKRFSEWWPDCGVVEDGRRCGKEVIGSHSLQRSRALKSISENNHVIGFSGAGYGRTSYTEESIGKFEYVPTTKASRFFGLCADHDNKIFREVETRSPSLNYRYILISALRAVIYEAVRATQNSIFLDWLFSVPSFDFPFSREILKPERDNARFHASYQWTLLDRITKISERKSIRKLLYFSALFEGKARFSTSANFCIELDLDGNTVQDFSVAGSFNYCQMVAQQFDEKHWVLLVSGIDDQNGHALVKLLKSLDKQASSTLADAALRMAVVHSENTYFRPSWINSLAESQKKEIIARFEYGIDFLVGQKKIPTALAAPFSFSVKAKCLKRQLKL